MLRGEGVNEDIFDIINEGDLAKRPELSALVEAGVAVDYVDAKHIWAAEQAMAAPGTTEEQRIRLRQAELERHTAYKEQRRRG